MKKLYISLIVFAIIILVSELTSAQVVITSSSMPSQGDTIRVSSATYLDSQITDPAITGFDHIWDYSGLQSGSQTVLNFINPIETNFIYYLVFGPSVANLALAVEGLDFVDLQVSDAYEFYKKSSTEYVRAGYAASIMGVPLPMKYDVPERIYKFPLSVNSTPDSSISTLTIEYPQVASFYQYKKRVNRVDGSGTLVTPYGTYSTLRVKSVIFENDSLYIDSLQTGFPIIRNIIEYKWLSPDFHVPLLTITQEGLVYTVQYIDSVRSIAPLTVDLGNDVTICQGESITINAMVQGGNPPYSYLWSNFSTTPTITVTPDETTTYSVIVCDSLGICSSASVNVNVITLEPIKLGNDTVLCAEHSINFLIEGNYESITWFINNEEAGTGTSFSVDSTGIGLNSTIIKVTYRNGECTGTDEIAVTFELCGGFPEIKNGVLKINPNPATENIVINSNWNFVDPVVSISSINGPLIKFDNQTISGKRLVLDISKIKPGLYFIVIQDFNRVTTGKFIKL